MRGSFELAIGAVAVLALVATGCDDNQSVGGADASDGTAPVHRDATVGDARVTPDIGRKDDAQPPPVDAAPSECDDGDARPCEDVACPGGEQTCVNGHWAACAPPAEVCNGEDDDCDGDVDEDFPVGEACTAGEGECAAEGTNACSADGTGVECDAVPGEVQPELCDDLDNDCDGVIDNACLCEGDEQCQGGEACIDGACVPVGDPCDGVSCPPGEVCEEGECVPEVDPCAGVTCDPGQMCVDGLCVDQPLPCMIDADCAPDEVCMEGVCMAAPQPCAGDDECPPGTVCDTGLCLPVDPCADVDCPMGEMCQGGACVPIVDPCMDVVCGPDEMCVDGACVPGPVPCEGDADCPADQICVGGACMPAVPPCLGDDDCNLDEVCENGECVPANPPCEGDQDCPDDQICQDGVCQAPACLDDLFEENDDRETATALVDGAETAGIICGGDRDVFTLSVADEDVGCRLTAHLAFLHENGDVDLRLQDADGVNLDSSLSVDDDEDVGIELLAGGDYFFDITLFGNGSNEYAITAHVDCSDRLICPEDDDFEDNDELATAQPMESGDALRGIVCGGDLDYFSIVAEAGDTLNADLGFQHQNGDLNLRLLDADGGELAASNSADDDEDLQFVVGDAGTYYMEVSLNVGDAPGENTYDLAVRLSRPVICPDEDDAFEDNDDAASATPLAFGAPVDAVVCADDEDFYAIELGEDCRVAIDVRFAHADGDIDIRLIDENGERVAQSLSTTDNESLDTIPGPAGTYYLAVSLFGGGGNRYRVGVDLLSCPGDDLVCPDDDPLEENDNIDTATPLVEGEPQVAIACGADQDFYAVDVAEGCTLAADLTFIHADGDLDLRLLNEAGEGLDSSVGVEDNERIEFPVEADGMLYLRVDHLGAMGNRYTIEVNQLDCPHVGLVCPDDDPFEENDDLENAAPIGAGVPVEGIVCGNDVDYFTLEVDAGCTVTADLAFTNADGDLDMRLQDADGGDLDTGMSVTDDEHVEALVEAGGTVFVRVNLFGAQSNTYALTAAIDCEPPTFVCPDDDPLEDNDDIANASPLLPGDSVEGIVCGGDLDVFAVEAQAGCTVSADLAFAGAQGDLDLRLQDADGTTLDGSLGVGDAEHVETVVDADGTYYLRINLIGASNLYALSVAVSCAPPGLVCPDDDALEENDVIGSATGLLLGVPREAIVCGNDLDYYLVEAGPGCTVTADLTFSHADGDLDLRLQDVDGSDLATSLGFEDNEALSFAVESAGRYYLRVNLAGDGGNTYTIEANVVDCPPIEELCPPDDAFEPNNELANATPLVDGAAEEGIACNGDVDLFAFEAEAGCTIAAGLSFQNMFGDLDLRLLDGDGGVIAQSLSSTDNEAIEHILNAAGTYYLRINNFGQGGNRYGLALDLRCPGDVLACPDDDAFEENDDVASAAGLVAGVTVQGIVCGEDLDVFAVPAEAGCLVQANLEFAHAGGDLDLRVLAADGSELGASDSVDDNERVEIATLEAGDYFVEVDLLGMGSNVYDLTVDVVCEGVLVCPLDDGYEENDDPASASAVDPGAEIDAILCGDDLDDYAVEAAAGCTVSADVSFLHASGDIDARLLSGDGVELDRSAGITDSEHVEALVELAGTYYLEVSLLGDANRYTATINVDCPVGTLVINEVDYDQPGADQAEYVEILNAGAAPVGLADKRLLLINGADGSVYATYDLSAAGASLDAGQYLVVGAAPVIADLPPDVLSVELPNNGLDNGSPDGVQLVARGPDGDEVIDSMSYEGVMDGVTEGAASAPDDDGLNTLSRCPNGDDTDANADDFALGSPTPGAMNDCDGPGQCPADDPLEENDDAATATPLASGDTARGVICGADEDYFAIELPGANCSVSANLEFVHQYGNLDLRMVDADGTPLASSISMTDNESILRQVGTGGTYYLVVNLAEGDENAYRISATVFCPEGELVINEFDYDQPVRDTMEFIEVLNVGFAPVALADIRVELIDGLAPDAPYEVFNLAGAADALPAGGYLIIGTAGVLEGLPAGTPSIEIQPETIQNGSPDGIRLMRGAGDQARLLDSVAYEGIIEGVTEGPERLLGDNDIFAWGRCPNGLDSNNNREDFDLLTPSPGMTNACPLSCPDDDEFEPNDALLDAPGVNRHAIERGIVCGGNVDYFVLDLGPGCHLAASIEFSHADGNLDLRLQSDDGTDLVTSLSETDDETVEYDVPALSNYYLRVNLASGAANTYVLRTDAVCP